MLKYSIVVPCYNEEKNIGNLVQAFVKVYEKLKQKGFELILVNNGSMDGTQKEIEKAMAEYSWVNTILVEKNQGYGYGILQGLKKCTGEYIGWLHADLQIPPEALIDIDRLIAQNQNDKRVFYRGRRRNRPIVDTIFTFGMSIFETIYLKTVLYDINAQPTVFSADFYKQLTNPPYDFSLDLYVYYMAKKMKFKIERVNVYQRDREEGASSWNTGMRSRMKLVQRTLEFSKKLKHMEK